MNKKTDQTAFDFVLKMKGLKSKLRLVINLKNIIEVTGLKKSYGDVEAVKGIDFQVQEGQMFAFLGPNGAGKSTTVEMLCTLLASNGGKVLIDGFELGKQDEEIRKRIGVVFQNNSLDALLKVKENLRIRGSFYGLKGEALEKAYKFAAESTGITGFENRQYHKLSGGQKRRADIARALMHSPKILFLDEPTTGLDPQTRKAIWETIREMQKKTNMTVFLTTHYMEEAAKADYVVVIDGGKITASGTPTQLRDEYAKDLMYLTAKPDSEQKICEYLNNNNYEYRSEGGRLIVTLKSTVSSLPVLKEFGDEFVNFEVVAGTMDDAFISITGGGLKK